MRRRFFQAILFLSLLTLVGLAYGVYRVEQQPSLLFNSYTLNWASDRILRPLGIEMRFAKLELDFERHSFWERTVRVKTQNFSLRMEDVDLIVPSLDGIIRIHLHPKDFLVQEFGPLQAKGLQLQMKTAAESPASLDDPDSASAEIPAWLPQRWAGPIDLGVDYLRWEQGSDQWYGGPSRLEVTTPVADHFEVKLALNDNRGVVQGSQVHIEQMRLAGSFYWDRKTFKPLVFGPLDARGLELDLRPVPKPPDEKDSPIPWKEWLTRWEKLQVEPLALHITKLRYQASAQETWQGALLLGLTRPSPEEVKLNVTAEKITGLPVTQAQIDLRTRWKELDLQDLQSFWTGQMQVKDLGSLRVSGHLFKKGDQYQYLTEGELAAQSRKLRLHVKGSAQDRKFGLELRGQASNLHNVLPSLTLQNCTLTGTWNPGQLRTIDSFWKCSLLAERGHWPEEASIPILIPKRQELRWEGPIRLGNLRKKPDISAQIKAHLPPWESSLLRAEGDVLASLSGPLGDFTKHGKIHLEGGTLVRIASFQNLVREWRNTDWEIPAPFHTLDGPLTCKASARIDIERLSYEIPLHCQSELASSRQSLKWTAEGQVASQERGKPLLSLNLILEQIQLELPKLSLGEPLPQVLADKRFLPLSELPGDGPNQSWDWSLTVKTPDNKPVLIVSNLLKEPLPITVNLEAKSSLPGVIGTVSLANYKLDLMKKKARIEELGLRLLAEESSPQLFGLLRFEDMDTKIALKLAGTLDRPFYVLESQPPRPPTELLSMILFGGRPDAMSDDNLRSVEQTRAAMVDGAIGLVSMFYLASTPIDSVGYNPYTGVFRARVQLGQGTSLFVGSDLEGAKQSIGLRRRLTENWSFETGAETSETEGKNKGLAMFKWGKRY